MAILIIQNKKKFYAFVMVCIVTAALIAFGVFKFLRNDDAKNPLEEMTLSQAEKNGEKKTVQLLIQIYDVGSGDGRLERGDVVLSAPEDKQFSIAEQEGFLIIKIRLTESQQELMTLALNEKQGIFANEEDRMNIKEIKRRKFAVDLEKIGISTNVTTGRVVSDKIFDDDILREKK